MGNLFTFISQDRIAQLERNLERNQRDLERNLERNLERKHKILLSTVQRTEFLLQGTYEIVLRDFNAYDQISATQSSDAKQCKTNFMAHFNLKHSSIRCALTELSGKTTLAHILPRSTKPHILKTLSLSTEDHRSVRNLVFLSWNLEKAFDQLQVSFIPKDALHDDLVLKIWDDSVKNVPVFDDSKCVIGQYENHKLNFDLVGQDGVSREHKAFRRCFAYQACKLQLESMYLVSSLLLI